MHLLLLLLSLGELVGGRRQVQQGLLLGADVVLALGLTEARYILQLLLLLRLHTITCI